MKPALLFALLLTTVSALAQNPKIVEADICVYGGTSGGVAAAVEASRMGRTVVIAEPGKHLGGMTAGGLSAVDVGDPRTVGGIAREYFTRLVASYGKTLEWEKPFQSVAGGPATGGAYAIEPHVAERVFTEMVREAKAGVHFQARLASVKKEGARLVEFTTEGGTVFRAKMFIDATYEGDLMAKAGIAYTLQREGNAKYGEKLNGILYGDKFKPRLGHVMPGPSGRVPGGQGVWDRDFPLDPYVIPGEPKSGLLPLIQPGDPGRDGEPAPGVQAYCYRLCLTKAADRIPIAPPPNYDPKRYEIVARFIAACLANGDDMDLRWFSKHDELPNGKWDFNTATFGGNLPGASWEWPDATYARREEIAKEHENYHRGLLHFLATDPRVPAKVRDEMKSFGLPRDEFTDTGGWPHQLYIREARRMISDLVMTEHHTFGREVAPHSVSLGSYGTDTHEIRRIVKDGVVAREGKSAGGRDDAPPYPIGYAAIVPKSAECENLFVTFALSASHTAYSSIRMEPVFMATSQSAAAAASIAIADGIPAQKVDYAKLRQRLDQDGQVLEWKDGKPAKPTASVVTPSPWKKLAPIPNQVGVAGYFAGLSKGALIVAGGANFPDGKMPWEGGTKVWHEAIYVLTKPTGKWLTAGKLPRPLGYGVSITTPKGVACFGGSDAKQHYQSSFLLSWDGQSLKTLPLPDLPHPCANACGALLGNIIYIAGGSDTPESTGTAKNFWALDLSAAAPAWKQLEPWPGRPRMLANAAVKDGVFYLFSGTDLKSDAAGKPERERLRDAFAYTPGAGWKKIADLPRIVVAAFSPAPIQNDQILLIGGDNGTQASKPFAEHTGFSRDILAYDPSQNSWSTAPFETPFSFAVGTCVEWGSSTIFPGGEIRPGKRSPEVWSLAAPQAPPITLRDFPLLFADDSGIAKIERLTRTVHRATTLEAPVLEAATAWEGDRVYCYGSVYADEKTGLLKLWYMARNQGENGVKRVSVPGLRRNKSDFTLFATSTDGLKWTKPALGIYECDGKPDNNIICDFHSPSVLLDRHDPDAARRYKMLGYGSGGYYAAWSPDGLHWTGPENPILKDGDTITLSQDARTGEYLAYHKKFAKIRGFSRRVVWLARSRDFLNWSEPKLVFAPDEEDDSWTARPSENTQVYNMSVYPHAAGFVGLPTIFRVQTQVKRDEVSTGQSGTDGPIDVQLTTSTDGEGWHRTWPRENIIPRGAPGSFAYGAILGVSSTPVHVGDKTWVYYTALTTTHGGAVPPKRLTIGRAEWRRHGFVSLDAGPQGARLETKSLQLTAPTLLINADSARGQLRAALVEADGRPIAGFTLEDFTPLKCDNTRAPAQWKNNPSIPTDRPIRVILEMTNTRLYSLQ
jgi:N-acetylneuraminic acid mutarotase